MSARGPVSSAESATLAIPATKAACDELARRAVSISAWLRKWFGPELAIVNGATGELVHATAQQPHRDWEFLAEVCRQVVRYGQPSFIEDEDPLLVLAIPLGSGADECLVAVGTFVTRPLEHDDDFAQAAHLLGLHPQEARRWAMGQTPIAADTLERMAQLVMTNLAAQKREEQLAEEVEQLSGQIGSTYEEISLIYRLTQNLKISSKPEKLAQIALKWLADVLPAQGLVIRMNPTSDGELLPADSANEAAMLTHGRCPLDSEQFGRLIARLGLLESNHPVVVNHAGTNGEEWEFSEVRELVAVPLLEGERAFGWLAAVNHRAGLEFGSAEASLLSSVGTILGIHSGNIDLYKQQADLLAGVVRVMSSAIDAKDPYTCGHSDRVARVSVRLAQELGCNGEILKTLYLGGLLHDIGKIGIDDSVLRKPGRLTEAEYEHIKTHVEIGYRILRDLKKMGHVLPVVLHHHESWDGKGYPFGMAGTNIPLLARIAAVADAYDAMSSDRPYRKGMDDEKLNAVIREGAGQQWDPNVVDAFFHARDDIREIAARDPETIDTTTLQWT
jgi:putative nucleotidyltransferase with HDIG domain